MRADRQGIVHFPQKKAFARTISYPKNLTYLPIPVIYAVLLLISSKPPVPWPTYSCSPNYRLLEHLARAEYVFGEFNSLREQYGRLGVLPHCNHIPQGGCRGVRTIERNPRLRPSSPGSA